MYAGLAWKESRRILIRIGSDKGYPQEGKYPGRVNAPSFMLADRIEALVHVTAHELAHHHQWIHSQIRRVREAAIDGLSLLVLDKFRANRESLLADWHGPPVINSYGKLELGKGSSPPKKSIVHKRAEKALRDLERWQRKLKLASTKVKKLKQRVRYYDRTLAAKSHGQG